MTMNRLIHQAVRRDLERLVRALEDFTEGDRGRAQGLARAFANLRAELTHHHEGEDRWVWPMLATAGVESDLLSSMEAEHQSMSQALAETSRDMDGLAVSASAADARTARESMLRTPTLMATATIIGMMMS